MFSTYKFLKDTVDHFTTPLPKKIAERCQYDDQEIKDAIFDNCGARSMFSVWENKQIDAKVKDSNGHFDSRKVDEFIGEIKTYAPKPK